ncbi:GRAS protein [Artemisia annua]|uniref:GRAS protein n=1 Tax=Artemisia annua TaxID=35608 RepID=A0A2U1L8B8_ARTAN|nr:GRAS protein [Artemisia annua]
MASDLQMDTTGSVPPHQGVATQSTLDSSSPPVQVDDNIREGCVEPVPHAVNELVMLAQMATDAIEDLWNAFVAGIKAKSTTLKPTDESPIVQVVDINTNGTSSVGAAGLRDAQPIIDTSFHPLVEMTAAIDGDEGGGETWLGEDGVGTKSRDIEVKFEFSFCLMVMESGIHEYTDYNNGFSWDNENMSPVFDHVPNQDAGTVTAVMSQIGSPEEYEDSVSKYLNQILVEENMESRQSMFHDPFALQATEQEFFEALGKNYPLVQLPVESPEEMFNGSTSEYSTSGSNSSFDPKWVRSDSFETKSSVTQAQSVDYHPLISPTTSVTNDVNDTIDSVIARHMNYPLVQLPVESPEEMFNGSTSEYSTSGSNSSFDPKWVRSDSFETKSSVTQAQSVDYHPLISPTTSVTNDVNDTIDSVIARHMVQNIFTDSESMLLFKKGMEEASKFLPPNNPLVIDLDRYNLPSDSTNVPPNVVVKVENVEMDNGLRGRKHSELEYSDFEDERTTKQSAVYEDEEAELAEFFDKLLRCTNDIGEPMPGFAEVANHNNLKHVYNGWNAPWRPGNTNDSIDIKTLLIKCAQSVATDDHEVATEQLKQIRQHTSPTGNASQRLAHIFALGLEARISGTGSHLYTSQKATQISAAEKMRAFQACVSVCPFKQNEIYFANKTIHDAALTCSTLHIVDFGIGYGFQWPVLVKHLAVRPGGPPKLRITGIELPQRGFRPADQVEETGRRLATYCEMFKVPFEYNAIATQNWEMIKIEDMKLQRNEFLVVNCLARFENLHDETNVKDSPRDRVLKLVRDMKPDIFVHSIVNGSYGAPFFVTRFKEALFHYSALFDMFDATIDRDNEQRQNYEKSFFGREVMNVIACEGHERVERPETYKQWQVRISRAGFKARHVDREIFSQLKSKVKIRYHKDFVLDDDGKWMLQGWKGRILCAVSCWVPA